MTQNTWLAEVTPFCLRSESKPALAWFSKTGNEQNHSWFIMIYYDSLLILLFYYSRWVSFLAYRTPVTTQPNNAENKSWYLNLWPFHNTNAVVHARVTVPKRICVAWCLFFHVHKQGCAPDQFLLNFFAVFVSIPVVSFPAEVSDFWYLMRDAEVLFQLVTIADHIPRRTGTYCMQLKRGRGTSPGLIINDSLIWTWYTHINIGIVALVTFVLPFRFRRNLLSVALTLTCWFSGLSFGSRVSIRHPRLKWLFF
jgi:hypothetical protein